MKTSQDPRHIQRQHIIQHLFAHSFQKQTMRNEKAQEVVNNLQEIDGHIEKIAPEFPISQINKVDLAILRLAVYEIIIEKSTPPKVVVDEAIELAKEFGGESSPAFVNGALGKLLKQNLDKKE